MTTIHYSRAKLIFSGAFLMIGAPVLGLFCLFGGPIMMLIGLILLIGGPLMSLGRIVRALGDGKAIEYDARQITLHALGKTRKLNWREVTAIEVETLTQRIYGFIPVSRQHSIRISHSGGVIGTARILIPFNVLALDKTAIIARLADMERLRGGDGFVRGGAGVSRAAMQDALTGIGERTPPETGAPEEPASDFDADAVMARYLARREAEAQAIARAEADAAPRMPPRVAGFGRKRA